MSALGQKQTYAVHQPMSALPPIATAKADFRKQSCLLYPQKRTCAVHYPMSALGQKRTSRDSLDQFVGALLEVNRYVESERPSRLQVDDKLEFRRLQDRQVSGLSAVEDLTGISADLTIHAHTIGVVTHQAAGFDSLAGGIARRNPIARREGRKLDPPAREEYVTIDEQGIGTVAYKVAKAASISRLVLALRT